MPDVLWFAHVGRFAEHSFVFNWLQFKPHSPAASAANAGGLLQTSWSEVSRQRILARAAAIAPTRSGRSHDSRTQEVSRRVTQI